jgi:uncharacterized protein
MAGKTHEIRDAIHIFVRLDSDERRILNSAPFQRLRDIHQLAMTYLVYPGATHRRFEHSLGVMELASRIYDVVANPQNLYSDAARKLVPEPGSFDYQLWRRVLRMAALCHDMGHLPFSHAPEDLLPAGWSHERISLEIIRSDQLKPIWDELKINPEHVAKLAVGQQAYGQPFSEWEDILTEIITGDAFGADRIDYLLRDSLHAGVSYGRFDHFRLVDTLRILPKNEESKELTLGIHSRGSSIGRVAAVGTVFHVYPALLPSHKTDLRRSLARFPQGLAVRRHVQRDRSRTPVADRQRGARWDSDCKS